MRKKDQYRDLSAADFEEESNTLITTELLFKIDKNSLFIRHLANAPTKDQNNKYDSFDHNTDGEAGENENSSTSTEQNINDTPKDSFSILVERLDTLQNFLLSEIFDIKAEMKNKCNQMTSKEISAGNDEKIELLQNQIIYLRKQCNSKNQLINVILKNVFKSDMPKVTCYKNSNTLLTPNDDYQFPERYSKNNHQKSSCSSCTHDNRFRALSVNEDTQNSNEDLRVRESSRETAHSDDNQNQKYSTRKTTRNRPVNRKQRHKNLPVMVILGYSIVKKVKWWELPDENNKVVTKEFSGATTDDMTS